MQNKTTELDELWETLAKQRHISGEDLIKFFERNGGDAESAYAFYAEWKKRGVLGIPEKHDPRDTVKGTRVPIMIRRTDDVGVEYLRSLNYFVK